MLYLMNEMSKQFLRPLNLAAKVALQYEDAPWAENEELAHFFRPAYASLKLTESLTRRYGKPDWNLPTTEVNGKAVPVDIETVVEKPFGSLIRFARDPDALRAAGKTGPDPRVLIAAPMSGHYATLLRGTVQAMLPDHEVYITDWADARDVPVLMGRFDLNTYIDYLIDFYRAIGPGAHTMAVCQPGPPVLAAVAVMSAADDPATPRSMTFMGSPIDARKSPTVTNLLAERREFEWFEKNMIATVPAPYAGVTRRVYPGFLQLFSFMSMNAERHIEAQFEYFQNLLGGDFETAMKHETFYDEYFSVCDMTAEFYLQTIQEVFQNYSLPKGELMHHGEVVDCTKIKKTALLTVEGELDDISGIGQTQAAHTICTNIPADDKEDYIQEGAGHYGVFNGSKWRTIIQPKIQKFVRDRFDVAEERQQREAIADRENAAAA